VLRPAGQGQKERPAAHSRGRSAASSSGPNGSAPAPRASAELPLLPPGAPKAPSSSVTADSFLTGFLLYHRAGMSRTTAPSFCFPAVSVGRPAPLVRF